MAVKILTKTLWLQSSLEDWEWLMSRQLESLWALGYLPQVRQEAGPYSRGSVYAGMSGQRAVVEEGVSGEGRRGACQGS